jgi:Icc-related predicted phosphoesterase
MTHVVAVSDLHGSLPEIPECDLLLIAGDVTPVWNHERRYQATWLRNDFSNWLMSLPTDNIVGIGGNHDFVLQDSKIGYELPWTYLQDEGATIAGLKVWGSPWSNQFGSWAFMSEDYILDAIWDMIPDDIDILVTHGPAHGYGDKVPPRYQIPGQDAHVGSESLAARLEKTAWTNLRAHVYGHIHEGYGEYRIESQPAIRSLNVSHLNDDYKPVNDPVELEL